MKRLIAMSPVLFVLGYAVDANAQSAGCTTGFSLVAAETGNAADLNLDGYVCESEADVRPNGIVETTVVDNDAPLCGCPTAFVGPLLLLGSRADRNEDGFVCQKVAIVGPPGETVSKVIHIDNRKCNL